MRWIKSTVVLKIQKTFQTWKRKIFGTRVRAQVPERAELLP